MISYYNIAVLCVSMFLVGCASKQTVICIVPTGAFEPETGQELLDEINDQLPFTIKPQEFLCKVKYDRLVGWAIIPDNRKDTAKEQLESSETLSILQVQVLSEEFKAATKRRWKASQTVRVKP